MCRGAGWDCVWKIRSECGTAATPAALSDQRAKRWFCGPLLTPRPTAAAEAARTPASGTAGTISETFRESERVRRGRSAASPAQSSAGSRRRGARRAGCQPPAAPPPPATRRRMGQPPPRRGWGSGYGIFLLFGGGGRATGILNNSGAREGWVRRGRAGGGGRRAGAGLGAGVDHGDEVGERAEPADRLRRHLRARRPRSPVGGGPRARAYARALRRRGGEGAARLLTASSSSS